MRPFTILALLALALPGCAQTRLTPQQRACEDQANKDPEISSLQDEMLGNASMTEELQPKIRSLRRQFIDDCLARMGDQPPGGGGVESPLTR